MTAPADDPLNLSVRDVADLTGLSVSTVRNLTNDGEIRCFRVTRGGKETMRKYRRSWVEEFIAAHTTAAAAK